MKLFLVIFLLMLAGAALAAVGVMLGRKPIAGSCGGVNAIMGDPDEPCEFCGREPGQQCKAEEKT